MTVTRSGGVCPYEPSIHGGKAHGLGLLEREGLTVPPFIVLSADEFRAHLRRVGLRVGDTLPDLDSGDDEAASARIRAAVEAVVLEPSLREALVAARREHLGSSQLAVRSSAVGEDSADLSFAGQHDTLLGIGDDDALERAVLRCWSSAFSVRALAYRRLRGLDPSDVAMGVVVQALVEGEVSGVMFTVHPVSGDRDRVLINAVFGLGEGVVSGELDADAYTVHRVSGEVQAQVAHKRQRVVGRAGGTRTEALPANLQRRPCLTDGQARELTDVGVALHARLGAPQDVEWTLHDGALVVLQTRPITALPPPPAPDDHDDGSATGSGTIWDNSNIIESYTGVTSPLTFSFAQRAYEIVYRQFHDVVGVPADEIEANADLYPHILGLLRGRVYYNLINVYRLVALLPGFDFNKPLLEQMMGLKDVADYAPERPPSSTARRYLVELPRLVRNAVQFGRQVGTVEGKVPGFFELFEEVLDDHGDTDFRTLPPEDIARVYADLERRLLWQWKVPIVNDFAVMIFYGVLRSITEKWGLDDTGALHHELLCGEGGLMSTEPAKAALRIARELRDDPAAAELFRRADADELARALREREPPLEVWDWIDEYLERFGYRCVGELKLEERSLRDDPTPLLTSLQGYLAGTPPDPDELDRRERRKRRNAEARVAAALRARPLRRVAYGWLLRKARAAVRDRENLRFCRTRIFGLSRDLFRGLGWQLYRVGELASPDDVFYLTVDDLFGLVHGTSTCTDLRGLAAVRRAEFARYRAEDDPDDHIVTSGIPYRNNPFTSPAGTDGPALTDGCLTGTPCSPGIARAPARVVRSPRGEPPLQGEILVASRTDPGWVTLYPGAAGLLIERGSPLSHSAVVARELGIPAVVGIGGLLDAIATGQTVEMDGGAGTVRIDPGESG